MSATDKPAGACCCAPLAAGFRTLKFPDGTQSGVFGLDEILADIHAEGMDINADTAGEIVKRLGKKNYISPDVAQEYCQVVMGEYEKYAIGRAGGTVEQTSASASSSHSNKRVGLFLRLLGKRR